MKYNSMLKIIGMVVYFIIYISIFFIVFIKWIGGEPPDNFMVLILIIMSIHLNKHL